MSKFKQKAIKLQKIKIFTTSEAHTTANSNAAREASKKMDERKTKKK